MYYEEKVIDGILCHRNDPEGGWVQFTSEELTNQIVELQDVLQDYTLIMAENMDLRRILEMGQKADSLTKEYFQKYKKGD